MTLKWIMVALMAFGILFRIVNAGKPRTPYPTGGQLAFTTAIDAAFIVAIIMWW
jgi:hypothetical protein